jgi:N-sulfoglucosamine sulfohydrolase
MDEELMPAPNILYVHSHDTGRYVQPYGHAVPTPNIQRLAEQGVLFRQAFCGGPTCSPSRACLLTGMNAHSSGMIGLAHRGFQLNDYRQHLVQVLRQAGYETTLAGQQHEAPKKEMIGYHRLLEAASNRGREVAPAAVEFLRGRLREPFFLSVGFYETHRQFDEPWAGEDPRYCLPPAPLPDTPETRQDMACFTASARALDDAMGQVFQALDGTGLSRNTLVICTTDHGIAFPGMKCSLTDHGIGVMLIMRGPGGVLGGKVIDAMVSQMDLFPTICEVAGIDKPAWLEGTSLLPLVAGGAAQIHDEIFSEVTYHAAYEPMRCVRTQRYKYIRRYDDRGHPILPNCDDSVSKDVLLARGWRDRAPAMEQLYDLTFDPNETHNVAADPSKSEVLADMRGRLRAWMERTNDPLLGGAVPAPPGAKVNDPDGLSPKEPPRERPA